MNPIAQGKEQHVTEQTTVDVFGTIRSHLESRGVQAASVALDARFEDDLHFDSLDIAELTLGIEEKLGVELSDTELEGLHTIRDAVDLVTSKLTASV